MHRFLVFLDKVMLLRRPLHASLSPLRCSIGKCYDVLSVTMTSADVSHNPTIRATRVTVLVLTSSQHTACRVQQGAADHVM